MEGKLNFGKIDSTPWVLSIGNFDGCHLGHQVLLRSLKNNALKLSAKAAVFSFYPHPQSILSPHLTSYDISTKEEKLELLKLWGIDIIYIIKFTKEFARLSPHDFFSSHLLNFHTLKKVLVGEDFSFGKNRSGSIKELAILCTKNNIEFEVVPLLKKNGYTISSSNIRKFLIDSDFASAASLLGRMWSVKAKVIKGLQLGQKLGFPTANLNIKQVLPIDFGVYAGLIGYQSKFIPAAINFGIKPTVSEKEKASLEVHLLNFEENIYNKEIEVFFLRKIRGEKKFSSLSHLKNAIREDIEYISQNKASFLMKFKEYLPINIYANSR